MVATSLGILLAMCVGCLATDPSNVTVTQTPTEMHLSIGDSAEIACIWEKSIKRYRISWYLVNKENVTRTVSSNLIYVRNVTREIKDVLAIEAASANDTGFYYCEIIIEIPFCKKVYGSGTTLVVEEREAQSLERKASVVWVIVPIIPFLAAVGSLYFCYRKKQKFSGSTQLPAPRERHQEEQTLEVAEIYGRTESTREEAGWAVSTLYNSLDSFYDASN